VLICLQIIFEERNNAAPGMNKVIVSAVLAFGAQIFIGTADLQRTVDPAARTLRSTFRRPRRPRPSRPLALSRISPR
jgi:hypothetical protein